MERVEQKPSLEQLFGRQKQLADIVDQRQQAAKNLMPDESERSQWTSQEARRYVVTKRLESSIEKLTKSLADVKAEIEDRLPELTEQYLTDLSRSWRNLRSIEASTRRGFILFTEEEIIRYRQQDQKLREKPMHDPLLARALGIKVEPSAEEQPTPPVKPAPVTPPPEAPKEQPIIASFRYDFDPEAKTFSVEGGKSKVLSHAENILVKALHDHAGFAVDLSEVMKALEKAEIKSRPGVIAFQIEEYFGQKLFTRIGTRHNSKWALGINPPESEEMVKTPTSKAPSKPEFGAEETGGPSRSYEREKIKLPDDEEIELSTKKAQLVQFLKDNSSEQNGCTVEMLINHLWPDEGKPEAKPNKKQRDNLYKLIKNTKAELQLKHWDIINIEVGRGYKARYYLKEIVEAPAERTSPTQPATGKSRYSQEMRQAARKIFPVTISEDQVIQVRGEISAKILQEAILCSLDQPGLIDSTCDNLWPQEKDQAVNRKSFYALVKKLNKKIKDNHLRIVTADHGVNPVFYHEKITTEEPTPPTGQPTGPQEVAAEEEKARLELRLAEVITGKRDIADYVERGIFGPEQLEPYLAEISKIEEQLKRLTSGQEDGNLSFALPELSEFDPNFIEKLSRFLSECEKLYRVKSWDYQSILSHFGISERFIKDMIRNGFMWSSIRVARSDYLFSHSHVAQIRYIYTHRDSKWTEELAMQVRKAAEEIYKQMHPDNK